MKILKHKNKQAGYSLLELVIYIAFFIMLSILIVRSLVSVMRTYKSASDFRSLQNNGELIMERITREIRLGNSVSTSSCPTLSDNMTLNSKDESGESQIVKFNLSNEGDVILTNTDGVAAAISTAEVTVSTLSFCTFTTGESQGVKSHVVLVTKSVNPVTADFYSTILLRGQ